MTLETIQPYIFFTKISEICSKKIKIRHIVFRKTLPKSGTQYAKGIRSINEGRQSPRPTDAVRGLKQICFVRESKSPAEVFAESDEGGEALMGDKQPVNGC